MGKGGGGSARPVQTVTAAEVPVTPAVAKAVERDTAKAQEGQAELRSRMRGIRSTYNRFASEQDTGNGTRRTLG